MTVEISYSSGSPGANIDAIATSAIIPGQSVHGITLNWSYSATPTGGKIQVISDIAGTPKVILDLDEPSAGPGFLSIDGFNSDVGKSLSFKVFAGGAGITGKANMSISLSDG